MTILFTGDWHLDAVTSGVERYDDLRRSLDWIADVVHQNEVRHLVFLGDLCDPDANRAPRCVSTAISFAERMHRDNVSTWWLTGNHDVIEDGSGTSTLSPLGAAGFPLVSHPNVEVVDGIAFIFLPFVPRAKAYDPEEYILSANVPVTGPVIIAGHLSSHDIEPGSETTEMGRGRDQWIPMDAIKSRFGNRALVVNGHYHQWQGEGLLLPGSLERLTFGEEANEPSVALVDVVPHVTKPKFNIRRVKNPHARRLHSYAETDAIWTDSAAIAPRHLENTIVRLKPPQWAAQDRIDAVLDVMKRTSAATKFVPAARDVVATSASVEAPQKHTRPRDAVMALIERVNSQDFSKDEFVQLAESIMDEEGV